MVVRYLAQPILKIDGQNASASLIEDIQQISVEESLHLPAMFTLIVSNPFYSGRDADAPWENANLFTIGKSVTIGFSSSTTEDADFDDEIKDSVIEGEITAIETHFTSQSQAPMIVRGYDTSHRLHRGRYNRSYQNMTDSDIVKKIAGEVGISTGTVESSRITHDYVFQENQTNMEFLRERAARLGFELFVQNGKLYFRSPKSGESLNLTWLVDIHSFRVRVTSAEQVKSVEVRGWDYTKKEAIVSTATSDKVLTSTEYGKGSKTSSSFNGKPSNPTAIVVDQPIASGKEAETMAKALFDELSGEFVHADARGEGDPSIRPGKIVKLSGMGKYSGKYYITETRHLYDRGTYTTEFSVRGLRGGDLLATLSPPTQLQPGQTLLVGKVTNNQDPKKLGRVRVKFPTLTEEHESNWARVVAVGAGANRGFDCLPEIDDEVLVAFEHGDIHRPYILGGVWNGKDAPPEKVTDSIADGKVRLRTVKTRTGHTLQFVEEDKGGSKKGIYVDTVYGHHLYLNDSEKFVEIKTKGGHQVRIDDSSKKILIKTSGGHSCELNDSSRSIKMSSTGKIEMKAPQSITLTVGGNKIEIATSQITVKSVGSTNVEGSITTVKGSASATLDGSVTNVKAKTAVSVSGLSIKLG